MHWLIRFNKALDYIEDHLTDELSYEKASEIACCSPYYFQRMFSYITGISVSEYIRRRKMTLAAFDIRCGNTSITEISLKYGYTSLSAFNRAFKSIHGISPSLAKSESAILNSFSKLSLSITLTGYEGLRYRIQEKGPLSFAGLKTRMTRNPEENFEKIPCFWQKTKKTPAYRKLLSLCSPEHEKIYGLSVYNDPKDIFYYIASSIDGKIPSGLCSCSIKPATWVIFSCEGDFRLSVQNIFRVFFTQWLVFSGYEYANLPDIEVYPLDSKKSNNCEVWIAVKKRT